MPERAIHRFGAHLPSSDLAARARARTPSRVITGAVDLTAADVTIRLLHALAGEAPADTLRDHLHPDLMASLEPSCGRGAHQAPKGTVGILRVEVQENEVGLAEAAVLASHGGEIHAVLWVFEAVMAPTRPQTVRAWWEATDVAFEMVGPVQFGH